MHACTICDHTHMCVCVYAYVDMCGSVCVCTHAMIYNSCGVRCDSAGGACDDHTISPHLVVFGRFKDGLPAESKLLAEVFLQCVNQ